MKESQENETQKKVGKYWDKQTTNQENKRIRWWQSPYIIEHINSRVCGKRFTGWNAGAVEVLNTKSNNQVFRNAISIGCGTGAKEMNLIEKGIVEKFVCYELSKERIAIGQELAERKGISEKIIFRLGDFFTSSDNYPETYDLVFWDNSLHHMLDTRYAIKISREILKENGYFFCNDFVGKNRFQWSDVELALVNGVRLSLPDEIYVSGEKRIPKFLGRPNLIKMIEEDPSEAADSESIIPAIYDTFDNPFVVNTGGVIYHTCLNNILQNIPERSEMLEYLLRLDDEIAEHGYTQYAFVLAKK